MILSNAPRNISSSSEIFFRSGRRRSSSLSASQVISRIVLSSVGLSTESSIIPYLPGTSTKTTPSNATSVSAEILCSICLESMDEESGDLYRVTECSHTYHKHCISQWKKHSTKCPCCRGPLPDELGATVSKLWNIPAEAAMPVMTVEGILENVIFGPIGVIWPICIISLFIVFETACFGIFIGLTFFMALYVIFKEESHEATSGICFVIILCLVFPPAIVILVICFTLQVFYVLYRTIVFYANVFACKMRWSSASKFIINRTVNLIMYILEVLEEL